MSESNAKAGIRNSKFILAASLATRSAMLVGCAIIASGCSERSSPAAPATASNATNANSQGTVPTSTVENVAASAGVADAKSDGKTDVTASPAEAAPSKPQVTRDITFDAIKFEMQKEEPFMRSMITPAIEKLNNTKIRIRGYIYPSLQASLSEFVLVRDNMQCCFGPGAALYDCIVVQMDGGKTIE